MQEENDRLQIANLLVKHLKKVESIRNHILKEYYEERTTERDNFKDMIDKYIGYVKGFMDAHIKDTREEHWPMILIDSIAEVQDMDYGEIERIKIVPPFYGNRAEGLDCASCLSPVGNALLLKKVGDEVTVKTPLGRSRFLVKSIKIPMANDL
ncbi:MAG: GreA/GreB family elongation factor [Clostridiales bacterium]|nr:GreA/GreB family elongation factor [Clostridiales bacterium]